MGFLDFFRGSKTTKRTVEMLLLDIPSLTIQERKLVENEFMKRFKPDYKLTKKEAAEVLRFLFKNRELSKNDITNILKRFNISYSYFSSVSLPRTAQYGNTNKQYFYKKDIDNALRGIVTLDRDERDLVNEALMTEYNDDDRLDRREVVQVVYKLYWRKKISDNDKKALFKKFGIGKSEIQKYKP